MTTGGTSFRYFVLGLLAQQPMSGYDIKRLLERLKWLIGSSSFGNIYPTLHALLQDGWVTVDVITHEDRPPKKVYTIRERGRQALRESLDRPVSPEASMKAFVMRLILAHDFDQRGLIACLRQRQAQVISHRDALEEMSGESRQTGVGWQLALDYGLAVADTELDWLDRALSRTPAFSEEVVENARVAG
jgi:DNA-binding PadR family transcriptional regulator